MATLTLPDFAAGLPAAQVDALLRQALGACDRARECAVLWFAEVQRLKLYRPLGHASLQLYATQALGFSDNRYYQFKRLAGPAVQIIIHQCPDCERAAVTNNCGEKRVAPAQLAALACDARVQRPGRANRATIKPSVRAAVLARDRHRCATAGCRSTHFLEVHHMQPRSQGGSNRAENLITLCSRCHGFVHEGGGAPVAAPTVAPAQIPARRRPDVGGVSCSEATRSG
jgi:hypothetical protein